VKHTIFYCLLVICSIVELKHAQARPIIADLSLRSIAIDSGFNGTDILLFGARNDAGDIAVVIRGPEISYTVRKKEKVAGIWVNREKIELRHTRGYYSVAASRPLDEIYNDKLLNTLGIGIDNIHWHIDAANDINTDNFVDAFVKNKKQSQLYQPTLKSVNFIGDTLFRALIHFPETIPKGIYSAEVYLFSDGALVGMQTTPLEVYKTGADAFIYDLAHHYPVLYGLLAIALALLAGWLAGAVFRKVQS
jgi:uncharacterized protein (TIGR02186 family)